jgi:DNA-binding MarR family transcriptional regulator
MTRVVWQWVRQQIHTAVLNAGFDDLNPAHVAVFRYPTPDGMRPSDLAEDMQITKQSVNDLLGHLERRGYLVREHDPQDSRNRLIRLTDRGRQVEDITWAAAAQAERRAGELLGADQLDEFRRLLVDLVSRLGAVSDGVAPQRFLAGDTAGRRDG